jgi:CHAT domain-containing protein
MQYREIGYLVSANRRWTIALTVLLIALCSGSVGLFLFGRDAYSENQIHRLIEDAYNHQRPGGGRLFKASYSPIEALASAAAADLGRAQFLLLRYPPSDKREELQGKIYLASGDWQKFIETVSRLSPQSRIKPATLNNLGTSFLALSETNPTYLLKALDEFERAAKLDPKAPEPHFNMVVAYRKLRLPELADETLQQYQKHDRASVWHSELTTAVELDEPALLDQLRRAVESNNVTEAERLFDKNPELWRRVAMQYGLSKADESEALIRFISSAIQQRVGDRTISAMLAPLFTDRRDLAIAARDLVTQGAKFYLEGNFRGSLEMYARADELAAQTGSLFDRLWVDISRADTLIRSGEYVLARKSLDNLIALARKHEFKWVQARALSIYGSSVRLTASYAEFIEVLSEADRLFVDIGASYDRVRPLYYLAGARNGAGDQDEALKLALECLQLTSESDYIRLSSLHWLIGSILYRQGMPSRAVFYERESVKQSENTGNPALETEAAATLANLYASLSEGKLAEEYLKVAEEALSRVPTRFEQMKAEISFNLVKARVELDHKRYKEAEARLQENLDMYAQGFFQVTGPRSRSLMLMARAYSETGRIIEAAEKFNEAIEHAESDDQYLRSEKSRVKFDDERRELYDSAIEFELRYGSPDAGWTYLQKYRAKLFLEFLAQFNPDIERIHSEALDRARVQKLVGNDTQIIEYALLKNQILIWLISDKFFTLRSVPVTRSDVEDKVQLVLQKLRDGDDVDALLEDLGKTLIEPVAPLLDPNRTVAIVPDRALHGLPFAALRRPGKKHYLIQDFPIIVSPSLTHLLATTAARPRRDKIVGFGSQNGASSEAKEIEALKTIYPNATTVSGSHVNKASFLAAMNTAAVFHYAGHSATDAVDPLRSSILLDGNRYGPNSVTAVDISQQRLPKNAVVILSSCDSSVGNSRDGVGVRGLTSAFLIGGAGSVVGSLWPVEASSTADLMIRFHRSFADSQLPVAKALRQAQLTFLETFPERSHPYYWSGFVVTGNFSALR